MLILCALLAAGPLTFVDQPLPGVQVGAPTPFTGMPSTNFLQEDLNGDRQPELILPDAVCFQEAGRFPEALRVAWPEPADGGEADVFGGAVYVRTPNHIYAYTRSEGAWHEAIEQPLDWPGLDRIGSRSSIEGRRVLFRRFTCDIDGDHSPELIDFDTKGVHIFRLVSNRFEPAGLLQVLPPMSASPSAIQAIWPETARRIVLPEQEMNCRILIGFNALTRLTMTVTGETREYFRETVSLQRVEGRFEEGEHRAVASAPVPAHVRPCFLNGDGTLDFAGSRWTISETSPVPMPVCETWASLDGGKSFHVERAPAFYQARPLCNFVDFDGDGDLDIVTETTGLFEGGIRETLNRYLTASRFSHTIRVRCQESGAFNGPVVSMTIQIDLGAPPASGSVMLDRYASGQIVNLTGDFNGDGFRDVVIREDASHLRVYLADGWRGFSNAAAAELPVSGNTIFSVADINDDGLADIVLDDSASGHPGATQSVYFTRGKAL